MKDFCELVKGDPGEVANGVSVEADDYFVRVCGGDEYCVAQFHVSVACL